MSYKMISPYECYTLISNSSEESAHLLEQQEKCCRIPPLYQVVLLNDDYTPMDFVVDILQTHFRKGLDEATMIMLNIHHHGRGVCGVYTKDVAQTKVELVMAEAQQAQHPLQCIMEMI